jgi:hypothetical protein
LGNVMSEDKESKTGLGNLSVRRRFWSLSRADRSHQKLLNILLPPPSWYARNGNCNEEMS